MFDLKHWKTLFTKPHPKTGRFHGDLTITHNPTGAVTITHQPHGEDKGDASAPGATATNEPNEGEGLGDQPFEPVFDLGPGDPAAIKYEYSAFHPGDPGSFDATQGGGGMDASSMMSRPAGPPTYDGTLLPAAALDNYTDDLEQSYQPVGPDPYDPPLREPTLRNYQADFGFDDRFYSGHGIAAIIGCEEEPIVGCEMGCSTDVSLKQ